MNILIVEDNLIIKTLYRELLNSWDFDFDMASNGLEAIELAQENNGNYDLCLMDIEMPEMNGIEATKIIRKTTSYFPIWAFTSNHQYEDICYQAGMDGFIPKPCSPDKLLKLINQLPKSNAKHIAKQNNSDKSEVMPMDKQHSDELAELARQDLCKMNIRSIGGHDLTVIVHKNVPYKISSDFVGNGDDISVFLDRTANRPAECHLYKSSCPMPSVFLNDNDFKEKLKAENESLKSCVNMVIKSSTDKPRHLQKADK